MSSKGYVYILTNPSMPGLVKIGKTTRDVDQRANELFQTGVPTPFKVEEYFLTPDCGELETVCHSCLSASRVSSSREFFKIPVEDAIRRVQMQLEEQISGFVSEYLESHHLVEEYLAICAGNIARLADGTGRSMEVVVAAIDELNPEDISDGLERYDARIAARKYKEEGRVQ